MPKIATRLYGLYREGNTLTNISDSTDILEGMRTSQSDTIKELTETNDFRIIPENGIGYFDILENSKDKKYGFSEVEQREDGVYLITCWKYRLDERLPYEEAVSELTENSGTWHDSNNVRDILRFHSDWWDRKEDFTHETINGFCMSGELVDMLRNTGFKSNIIIIAQP
jgi:hypothetical protein